MKCVAFWSKAIEIFCSFKMKKNKNPRLAGQSRDNLLYRMLYKNIRKILYIDFCRVKYSVETSLSTL